MTDTLLLLGIIISILASGGLSAAETVFFSLDRIRLKARFATGKGSSSHLKYFVEHPERFFVSNLIGNELVIVVYSSFFALLVYRNNISESITFIVSPLLVLVFSEAFPKALARQFAERLGGPSANVLYYFRLAIWPVAVLVELSVRSLEKIIGKGRNVDAAITRYEIAYALTDSSGLGGISGVERNRIRRLMTLSDRSITDVMTPRIRTTTIAIYSPVEEAIRLIGKTGHKRLVCYGKKEDDLLGVIYATDLLKKPANLATILKPVPIVPESLPILRLIEWLRQKKTHFALVIDEYGGFAGIVTLNDMAAEMVGPLQEGYGVRTKDIIRLSEKQWLVAGRVKLSHLTETIGFEIEGTHASTLGGLVVELADDVPDSGEEFKMPGVTLRVIRADSRGVRLVKIALDGNGL